MNLPWTPGLLEHGSLTIHYFIQPNDRQVVIVGMLEASEHLMPLSREIVYLVSGPYLLNMDLLSSHPIL